MKSCILPLTFGSLLLLSCMQRVHACGSGSSVVTNVFGLGGSAMSVSALGRNGELVGFSYLDGNQSAHAFLRANGVLTDLGTLGGNVSRAIAIENGVVVGNSTLPGEAQTHVVIFANQQVHDLGTLGGSYAFPVAINVSNQVAGSSLVAGDYEYQAFLFSDGRMFPVASGGAGSYAIDLNDSGWVTGEFYTLDYDTHTFLYTNGGTIDLGTLGGWYCAPNDLNNAGVVVGESMDLSGNTHAFLWRDGVLADLGTLGGDYSTALAVNEAGLVIGESELVPFGPTRGFSYSGGALVDLGSLGGSSTRPKAVNNRGQIVGVSELAGGRVHPFLWQDGIIKDLNSLLPADSGWELTHAQYINDAGTIVGQGIWNGHSSYFILQPGAGANGTPLAIVPPVYNAQCGIVTLDGSQSNDPDSDALSFEWAQGGLTMGTNQTLTAAFPPGTNVVTLSVRDGCGGESSAQTVVVVADTLAPVMSVPAAVTLPVGSACAATMPDLTAQLVLSDNCTAVSDLRLTQTPSVGTSLGLGAHPVTITVQDGAGNASVVSAIVTVVDVEPPRLVSLDATPSVLNPPNNQMIPVTVSATVADNCAAGTARILLVRCSGPVDASDIAVTGELTLLLRASKNADGSERVYEVVVEGRDAAGNVAIGTTPVRVPKDNSDHGKPGGPKTRK